MLMLKIMGKYASESQPVCETEQINLTRTVVVKER